MRLSKSYPRKPRCRAIHRHIKELNARAFWCCGRCIGKGCRTCLRNYIHLADRFKEDPYYADTVKS